ncbi:hypothetical protein YTPLAS18_37540 [Nitrospira sp.]|nr:hypothetical protein YTPLAS18_37540 [Nitrospira sp.]
METIHADISGFASACEHLLAKEKRTAQFSASEFGLLSYYVKALSDRFLAQEAEEPERQSRASGST